jgi:hypothetical protein
VVAETARRIRVAPPGGSAAGGFLDRAEVIRKVRSTVSREHQVRPAEVTLLRRTGSRNSNLPQDLVQFEHRYAVSVAADMIA